jgi:hypothetical protein
VRDLALPLLLSGSGVLVAAVAFYNRAKPDWQRGMKGILFLAVMQVVLGAISWLVVSR